MPVLQLLTCCALLHMQSYSTPSLLQWEEQDKGNPAYKVLRPQQVS